MREGQIIPCGQSFVYCIHKAHGEKKQDNYTAYNRAFVSIINHVHFCRPT